MKKYYFFTSILFLIAGCQPNAGFKTLDSEDSVTPVMAGLEKIPDANMLARRTVRIDLVDPSQGEVTSRGIGLIIDHQTILTVANIFSGDLTLNGLERSPGTNTFDIHSLQLDNHMRDIRIFNKNQTLIAEYKGIGLRDLIDGFDERVVFDRVHSLSNLFANTKASESIALFRFSNIDFSQMFDLEPLSIVSGHPAQGQRLYFYRYSPQGNNLGLDAAQLIVDSKTVGIANNSYVKDTLIQIDPKGHSYFKDGDLGAPLFGFDRSGKLQIFGMAAMIEVNNYSIVNSLELHSFMLFTDASVKRFLNDNNISFVSLQCH